MLSFFKFVSFLLYSKLKSGFIEKEKFFWIIDYFKKRIKIKYIIIIMSVSLRGSFLKKNFS
jgi:hypothetical protein